MKSSIFKETIAVIGLGYVGLPLLNELSKQFDVLGFDISSDRINQLKKGIDITNELSKSEINKIQNKLTNSLNELSDITTYIITVPTPIFKNKDPNLKPISSACKIVGSILKKNNIVIFESTVYPGLTEEFCVPILEKNSGLVLNKDFGVGYSPERINPGDKVHTVSSITKVVSGSNKKTLERTNNIYSKIIHAGTYQAPSIKVAEAAKVIENTQRDINIALINELSQIFNLLDINTNEVLDAACTKWNFHNFRPGLVGGHCIGVDPYYLTYKAKKVGFHPEMILSGRETNESMSKYIVKQSSKALRKLKLQPKNCSVLILGLTFKEDCPDVRNSKGIDLLNFFNKSYLKVHAFDPLVNVSKVKEALNIASDVKILKKLPIASKYQLIVLNTPHKFFKKSGAEMLEKLRAKDSVFFDVKGSIRQIKDSISL
jgi:UDP-N-acetyl-D-glucosamine/UDP-N-acetyl-D-galactosamine dehydrogenase